MFLGVLNFTHIYPFAACFLSFNIRSTWWKFLFFPFFFFFFFFFFCLLGPRLRHMEVCMLGVHRSYSSWPTPQITATWDPSHVCSLHHSSQLSYITRILMDISWVSYLWAMVQTPPFNYTNVKQVPIILLENVLALQSLELMANIWFPPLTCAFLNLLIVRGLKEHSRRNVSNPKAPSFLSVKL